ncbi:MAG: PIN domain-containing protein [Candidatus Adiutrix sp.]|nr:PIN domain-containing protein [Candidatus Adiutrix sp.]
MNWIARLTGKTVALDSAPLIYFMERHPTFFESVWPFFEAVGRGDFKIVTSPVTIAEVMVHPLRHGPVEVADTYQNFFAKCVKVIPVTEEIAVIAAGLRAEHRSLLTPDALQLATAIEQKADFFLTNDIRLGHIKPPEVLVLSRLLS